MTKPHHDTLVVAQFGARAAAYVESAVHAQGEDLRDLATLVAGHPDARVLDLGCGGGHASFAVAPHVGSVVAYDLSAEMLAAVTAEAASRTLGNLSTQRGPAESLPFERASFDFVITRFSAHHWYDVQAGLAEARRVLKPSGKAAFVDVVAPAPFALDTWLQTVELLRDASHVRDYSADQWTQFLNAAGFVTRATKARRLRLDFATWIARMQTPSLQTDAIRALQAGASAPVAAYFELEADGSFVIDTLAIEAEPASEHA
jgi:ubiquinone/menaquinone biosynthesis C-methylase UbiE